MPTGMQGSVAGVVVDAKGTQISLPDRGKRVEFTGRFAFKPLGSGHISSHGILDCVEKLFDFWKVSFCDNLHSTILQVLYRTHHLKLLSSFLGVKSKSDSLYST